MSRFTLLSPDTRFARFTSRVYKVFELTPEGNVTQIAIKLGTNFIAKYEYFNDFEGMVEILESVVEDGNSFIIRGDISAELEVKALQGLSIRRVKHARNASPPGFQPANRDWIMLDVDKLEVPLEEWDDVNPAEHPERAIEYVLNKLPIYFRGVSCWWQFSSSQNLHVDARTLSVHMFFMLDRFVEDETLRMWAVAHSTSAGGMPIDPNVFECIQPHFLAPPMFKGIKNPLIDRCGVYRGSSDRVIFDVPAASEDRYGDLEPRTNISAFINKRKLKPYLDAIGDDPGQLGFNEAIKSVVGAYYLFYGPEAIDLPLKSYIREAINTAPVRAARPYEGAHSPAHYASDDYLDPLIAFVRGKEREEKDVKVCTFEQAIDRYVYVEELERFLDVNTMAFRTKVGITDAHAHEIKDLSNHLLTNDKLKRVSRITYKPGAPEFCEDFDPDSGRIFRAYNKYYPPTVELMDPENATWFVNHVQYLCDQDHITVKAVLDWLACIVQFPDEKVNFGVLIQGSQGTGKSLIGKVMSQVLGPSNVTDTVTPNMVTSQFTEWMVGKQLIIIEEIKDRDEKFITYDRMKALITGPTLRINPKGLPSYIMPNRSNFLCFTNYEDAVPMDEDDRRFIIHLSRAVPKGSDYYDELFRCANEYCGAVRSFLLQRDLSNFNHLGRAPVTSAKAEFISNSGTQLFRWLKECIDGEIFPLENDLITMRDLLKVLPYQLRKSTDISLSINLRKLGAHRIQKQIRFNHGRMWVWAVRNYKKYKEMTEEEIVQVYEKPVMDSSGEGYYQKPISRKDKSY